MTFAWSELRPSRRNGVRSISAAWSSGDCWFQRGRMRSVSVRLGAIALTLMPNGPSSNDSLRVNAMMPPFAAQ